MILEQLPDIPRWYTGLAEWAAALVYIQLVLPRFSRAKQWSALALGLPFFIGLQIWVGLWPIELWTVGMALAVLSIFAFIHLTCDISLKDSGYLAARAFVLAELVASLQWQLWVHGRQLTTMDQGTDNRGIYVASIVFVCIAYAAGFGAAYLVERRNFARQEPLEVEGRSLITAVAIALVTFLVSNISFVSIATPISGQGGKDVFYIRTLVDLVGFIALYAQQSNRDQVRNALELAKAKLIMSSQHDQYLQSKRNIEELNRMHHDLKYYVEAIRHEESADQRSDFLNKLEDSIRGYESEIQTGNHMLDIVLNSKMQRCLQENISMPVMVQGQALAFMDSMSLSSLFGNALDNAIEASLRIPQPEQRLIRVSVFTQGDFVMARFENHYPHPVEFVDGLPRTTKKNRRRHGHGTANMKRVVESYGGSLTTELEDDWFSVRALIPTPGQDTPPTDYQTS